jgi:imidazoleglycerol phosphate dehydratase HisB
MSVYDVSDYRNVDPNDDASARAGLDIVGTPTASMHRRGMNMIGGTMSKSTIRSFAYFLIVGGVVVWVVGHLAPIRA